MAKLLFQVATYKPNDEHRMADKIKLHPETPHRKRIFEAVDRIRNGSVILFPTDSQYALGCDLNNKKGIERIQQIRQTGKDHLFTLICDSLSGISQMAHLSDNHFKLINRLIPGPYTFVLPATKQVPKLLLNRRRDTVGFRVPDDPICNELVGELGNPLIATTAKPANHESDGIELKTRQDLFRHFEKQVDLVIDNEQEMVHNQSTIIDMSDEEPVLRRRGLGLERLEEVFLQNDISLMEASTGG